MLAAPGDGGVEQAADGEDAPADEGDAEEADEEDYENGRQPAAIKIVLHAYILSFMQSEKPPAYFSNQLLGCSIT